MQFTSAEGISALTVSTGHVVFTNSNSAYTNSVAGNVLTLFTDANTTAIITTSPDSNTVTIQIDAPATQPGTPSPADPSLPQKPNPAPITPEDPGNFDGEFTVQPATPSSPLPPDSPHPAPPSGESYESRNNSASTSFASAKFSITPLARPIHTHASSHRDPRAAAALFSPSSLLTGAMADRTDPSFPASPNGASGSSTLNPAVGSRSLSADALSRAESPLASAGMGDPVSQWWKWTAYVAVAPSLFERRRAPITRINWKSDHCAILTRPRQTCKMSGLLGLGGDARRDG